MSGTVDAMLVGVVLVVSVGYAACALGPRALRRALLSAVASALLRLPPAMGLRVLARRLAAAAEAAGGSCGGCGDCGGAPLEPSTDGPAPGRPAPGTPAAGRPAPDIRVPVSSIGRRRSGTLSGR